MDKIISRIYTTAHHNALAHAYIKYNFIDFNSRNDTQIERSCFTSN